MVSDSILSTPPRTHPPPPAHPPTHTPPPSFHTPVLPLQPAVLHALLAARASPDVVDANRWTPLHYAARDGQLSMIQELLAVSGLSIRVVNTVCWSTL